MRKLAPGSLAFCLTFLLCSDTARQPAVVHAQGQAKPIVWRLQTSWPASNLIQLSVKELAKMIEEMSGGRLKGRFLKTLQAADAALTGPGGLTILTPLLLHRTCRHKPFY